MGHIYLGKDSFEKLRLSRPKQLENKSTKGSLLFKNYVLSFTSLGRICVYRTCIHIYAILYYYYYSVLLDVNFFVSNKLEGHFNIYEKK